MHPVSEARIGQILNPIPMSESAAPEVAWERISLEQVVNPRYASGTYPGPERRAQGYIVADVIDSTFLAQQAEAEPQR